MKPEDINRTIAEKVMGWHSAYVPGWNPCNRIEHAWMVVEKLSNEWYWTLRSPFDNTDICHAGLTPKGVTGWNGRPDIEESATVMMIAICLAALKAKEEA